MNPNYITNCYLNLCDSYELYRNLPFFSWLFGTNLERRARTILYHDIRAASQAVLHCKTQDPHEATRLTFLLNMVETYVKTWAKE